MSKTVLFIDGENFLHKVEKILRDNKEAKGLSDITTIDLNKLMEAPLQGIGVDQKIFYASKIRVHPETEKKSLELIKAQRKLRNTLVNQGCIFIMAGNVRGQKVDNRMIFKEKGVDVKIAVDMVAGAHEKTVKTIILCSSDSDLQPAIAEAKRKGVEIIYLGFEMSPNKGLTFTTDRTILIRNSEVLGAFQSKK